MSTPFPDWLQSADADAFLAVHRWLRSLNLGEPMRLLNELGNAYVVAPILLALSTLTRDWRRGTKRAVHLLLVMAAMAWGTSTLKHHVDRDRPYTALTATFERGEAWLYPGDARRGLGFPSGHTSAAFGWALPLFVWCGAIPIPARRRLGRASLLLTATGVGLARIYNGAHFPLDVVGGAALAAAATWPLAWLLDRLPGGPLGRGRTPAGEPPGAAPYM